MRVQFIEGEDHCRLDGMLLNDDRFYELCGVPHELNQFEGGVIIEDVLYLKEGCNLHDLLLNFGSITTNGDRHYPKEVFQIHRVEELKDVTIQPYKMFQLEYPMFNQKSYDDIIGALDEFYAKSQ